MATRNRVSQPPQRPVYPGRAPERYYGTPLTEAPTQMWNGHAPAVAQPQRRSGRWRAFLFLVGAVIMVMLATVAAIAVMGALLYTSDLILPGVQVMGVDLGGRTTGEAAALLESRWQQRPITLESEDSTFVVAPAALGLTLDAQATTDLAYRLGRSLTRLESLLDGRVLTSVSPVWQINPQTAELYLESLTPQLARPPVNASIQVVNGQVQVTPAVAGRSLDVTATMNQLQAQGAQVVNDGRLELILVPVEPAVTDVSVILAEINGFLGRSVTVRAYDPVADRAVTWTLTPELWNQWLTIAVAADASSFDWTLDEVGLETYLTAQAGALDDGLYLGTAEVATAIREAIAGGQAEVRARLYHQERQHVVQSGETLSSIGRNYGIPYPWIQAANPGLGDSLSVGQAITIPSPDVMLPLPIVEGKRIVVSISQQKAWVYENRALKWEWLTSTGIDSSPTAPGIFQVQSHEIEAYAGNWDLYMPYFMGIYQPVPNNDFMNGFHGFPTRDGSQLLWTNDLGHQVTYGCILLSTENAITLYEWAEEGVIVEVQP